MMQDVQKALCKVAEKARRHSVRQEACRISELVKGVEMNKTAEQYRAIDEYNKMQKEAGAATNAALAAAILAALGGAGYAGYKMSGMGDTEDEGMSLGGKLGVGAGATAAALAAALLGKKVRLPLASKAYSTGAEQILRGGNKKLGKALVEGASKLSGDTPVQLGRNIPRDPVTGRMQLFSNWQ